MNAMTINLLEDVCPVTEFRAEINSMLKKTKTTHRPIILTQHGKVTSVVLDISDYQRIVEQNELASDLRIAQQQFIDGKTSTTAQAKERIMKRYANVQS